MNSGQIDILVELTEEQLEVVTGGDKKTPPPRPSIHDLHVTKLVDKASPNLL